MDDGTESPDRAILKPRKAMWTDDPEWTLTDNEFDGLLKHFGEFKNTTESDLRSAMTSTFRHFMSTAIAERFRETDDGLAKPRKPSTIVAAQMKQVEKACEVLDAQLAQLDPFTQSWVDQYLKGIGAEDEAGHHLRLSDLKKHAYLTIDLLISAARTAEGMASRGPNNVALRAMVEEMATCWEMCHGKPPITDKGRGLRADPFLELCKEMAGIVHVRQKDKRGALGSLQLTGIVADVLKKRPSRTTDTLREK